MLEEAIALAVENVKAGGGPFGAIVVLPNGKTYSGVNRVTANNDPTAHAEVQAIRNACAGENTFDLTGAKLYTSCEPCPMCLGATLWARIETIVYAADRHDAASVGFDDAKFYKILENPPIEQVSTANRYNPFYAWKYKDNKTAY